MTVSKSADGACCRTILLAATLALGPAAAAQASTFTWDFSGTIAQPTNANPAGDTIFTSSVFSGQGTSTLIWGDPIPTGANPLSSLSIIGSAGSTALTSGTNTSVQFGLISWTNTSVFGGGGVWDTVLTFLATFGHLGFGSVSDTVTATINVNNTADTNSNPAGNNASGNLPDFITLLGADLGTFDAVPLDLGGGMALQGFSAEIVDVGQCGTAGTNPNPGSTLSGFVWSSCEGTTSLIGLSANVRYDAPVAPIPLPAAGWLLLGSLAGLGALRARRANRTV